MLHKNIAVGFAALLLTFSLSASAAALTYKVVSGDTLSKIAAKNSITLTQLVAYNQQIKNIHVIYPGQVINLAATSTSIKPATSTKPTVPSTKSATTTAPKPATPTVPITPTPSPTTSNTPAAGESRFTAYTTGYGWPDNTPAGAEIALGVIHSLAGGTGTYSDPITMAVGHVISGGKSTPDYPQGTKFYIPNSRKYFIVEDLCGDGNTPQNGPCHTGYQGKPWLDLWVGGQGIVSSLVYDCEDAVTDNHLVIQNPASNYTVVSGALTGLVSCAPQYGDTVVSK